MQERTVQLGNVQAVVTMMDDGTNLFRTKADDLDKVEINMLDNVGRSRIIDGFASTMLILEAVDPHGSLAYDPHPDPSARDEQGRRVFLQRPIMNRQEVFEIVEHLLNKRGDISLATGLSDITKQLKDGPRRPVRP